MCEKNTASPFTALARRRRSVRAFAGGRLSPDEVRELMKAPLMSPSSKGKRPWRFVLADDKVELEELSRCKPGGARFLSEAALAVVVAVDSEKSEVWIEDGSVAAAMLLLQAEAMGLGACWIQVRGRSFSDTVTSEEAVRRITGLPERMRVVAVVAVGRKGQERKEQDESRLLWSQVHDGRYTEPETPKQRE